jgi:hypothetical protein
MDDHQMKRTKIEQLRDSLAEPVRIVRQLGIEPTEAVTLFRNLVHGAAEAGDVEEDP